MKIRVVLLLAMLCPLAMAQQNALVVQQQFSAAGSSAWFPVAGYTNHTLTWSQVGSTTVVGCAVQIDSSPVNSGSGTAGGIIASQPATTNGTTTATSTTASYARITATGCSAGTIKVTYSAVNGALSKGGGSGGIYSGTAPIVVSGNTISCPTCGVGAIPFQTNSVNNTSQTGLNLLTSTVNAVGLTVTPTNPGTNTETFEITGAAYNGNAATATNVPFSGLTVPTANLVLAPSSPYTNTFTSADFGASPTAGIWNFGTASASSTDTSTILNVASGTSYEHPASFNVDGFSSLLVCAIGGGSHVGETLFGNITSSHPLNSCNYLAQPSGGIGATGPYSKVTIFNNTNLNTSLTLMHNNTTGQSGNEILRILSAAGLGTGLKYLTMCANTTNLDGTCNGTVTHIFDDYGNITLTGSLVMTNTTLAPADIATCGTNALPSLSAGQSGWGFDTIANGCVFKTNNNAAGWVAPGGSGTVTSSSSAQYQMAMFSTATNIQGITFGAGTTLQGSTTNPTATATPTLGVAGTTAGGLTLASVNAGTLGEIVLAPASGITLYGTSSGSAAITVSSAGVLALPSATTATSMSLTTPVLGTPTSGTITNLTGTCTNCTASNASAVNSNTFPAASGFTSGGLFYASSASAAATSALATQYGVVLGGGAGAAPQFTAAGAANMPLVGAGSANPGFSTIGWLSSATQWGIPYMSTATQMSTTAALTANALIKAGSAAAPAVSSVIDNGTVVALTEGETVSPTSTSQVGLIINNPTSTSVNIANFQVNGTNELQIGNTGQLTLGTGGCTMGTGWGSCGGTGTDGTPAANFGFLDASSAVNTYRWNVNNLTQTQQLPQTSVLHSNFTNSNTTFTTVGDGTRNWSWPVAANQDYYLDCTFTYEGATATSNSPNIQITGPAAPTAVYYTVEGTNGTTFVSANANAFSTSLDPFGTLGSFSSVYSAHIYMGLSNGTTAGNVVVQAKNTTSTDVLTIYGGSVCRFQ